MLETHSSIQYFTSLITALNRALFRWKRFHPVMCGVCDHLYSKHYHARVSEASECERHTHVNSFSTEHVSQERD